MIESYLRHHKFKLHIYGYEEDLVEVRESKLIERMIIQNKKDVKGNVPFNRHEISAAYMNGHEGTATVWASLIKTRKEKFFIHLDADTIFLGDVVTPIRNQLLNGFALVGTRRPYRYGYKAGNVIRKSLLWLRRDVVNTFAFGFRSDLVRGEKEKLIVDIRGAKRGFRNSLFPVMDFFDRISFRLVRAGGVYYFGESKQKRNSWPTGENPIDRQTISFAAVGSGVNFIKNPNAKTSKTYREFAISQYALFSHYLLGTTIPFRMAEDKSIIDKLERLNKTKWTLE